MPSFFSIQMLRTLISMVWNDNYFSDESNKIFRSSSSQNTRPISREGSVQRVPSSRNASQSSTLSSAPPIVDKDVLERYCKTILEEFALNNSIAVRIICFQFFYYFLCTYKFFSILENRCAMLTG